MRVAVIAASGRAGRAFVNEALAADMQIVAGVRSHDPFGQLPGLKVVKCDSTKQSDVAGLIAGCDAVVSLVGHGKNTPEDVQTRTIRNVCSAMEELGIQRLISLTGTGVRFSGDKITLMDRFLNFGVSLVDPKRVADGSRHVEVIQGSKLNWTIIRVLKLQNTKPGKYSLGLHGPAKTIVSRGEVAKAIVELLKKGSYVKKAPIISRAD